MKKIFITLIICFVGQLLSAQDITVDLCGKAKTISQKELFTCKGLTISEKGWSVKSYSVGFVVGVDFVSISQNSALFSPNFKKRFMPTKLQKIYIEKIILINPTGKEIRMGAQTYLVTP